VFLTHLIELGGPTNLKLAWWLSTLCSFFHLSTMTCSWWLALRHWAGGIPPGAGGLLILISLVRRLCTSGTNSVSGLFAADIGVARGLASSPVIIGLYNQACMQMFLP